MTDSRNPLRSSHCDQVQACLTELLAGDLAADSRAEINAHLLSCSPCATELETLQGLLHELRTLPVRASSERVWQGIERSLAGEKPHRWLEAAALVAAATFLVMVLFTANGTALAAAEDLLPERIAAVLTGNSLLSSLFLPLLFTLTTGLLAVATAPLLWIAMRTSTWELRDGRGLALVPVQGH